MAAIKSFTQRNKTPCITWKVNQKDKLLSDKVVNVLLQL